MAVSNRVRAALTTTVLTTAATGFMAGCAVGGEEDQVAYCTDEDGKVVDDEYCDDGYNGPGAGFFFLYLGGFRVRVASRHRSSRGGTRISPTHTAARQRAGLPGSGQGERRATRVSGGDRQRHRQPGRNRRRQLTAPHAF